jgi:guanylate kinase
MRRGLLLILSSPSGAGKSTLARMLMDWDPTLKFSVSATTRAQRKGEMEGREYYFVSKDNFLSYVETGEMLEHAEVFGNYYGSPKTPVVEALVNGRDVLFDVDWQGGQQIKQAMRDDVVSIFVLPPSIGELEKRLRGRGQDSAEIIARRMDKSKDEISHWPEYDYVLVNTNLPAAFDQLKAIVIAERLKRDRQPDLSDFVRTLNREFESR